ncbi:hypothetical protein ACFTAO_03640 [Paenibacillus rhizoplanae]
MKNHSLSSRFTRLGLAVVMLFAMLGAAVAPAGQAAAAQAGGTSAPAVSALPAKRGSQRNRCSLCYCGIHAEERSPVGLAGNWPCASGL